MSELKKDAKQLLKSAYIEIKKMRAKVESLESHSTVPIAIIGMGCRMPNGADTPQKLWEMLRQNKDAIREVPKERWDISSYYDPDPNAPGKTYTKWGSFVDDVDKFDASFFGIIPNEAKMMDPQQRLILEVVWETLENAGQSPQDWKDRSVGMFLGISNNDYERIYHRTEDQDVDIYSGTGNTFSVASGRVSFLLGFQGPNVAIDTACSSSLVTVHMACQSLHNKECDLALAGGVNLILSPEATLYFSKARMMSPDGHCKTFDESANGYVRGEGCGFVALKRLDDALKNKDNILAVVSGSAVNHDGRSSGLTVPNGVSQQRVIQKALENGQLNPLDIDYVECHGTGTSLGDPIEIQSLAKALGRNNPQARSLKVGSIKTNIGHLEAAAGIAGLIKLVLSLQNEYIPSHLHFRNPTSHIPWNNLSVSVVAKGEEWKKQDKIRCAGVSSFGFSGTNAHVIIKEPPITISETMTECPLKLLTLSAKTEEALNDLVQSYVAFLDNANDKDLKNICFTTQTGRSHFKHRLAAIGESISEIRESLTCYSNKTKHKNIIYNKEQRNNKVAFLFTGQGSQYPLMAKNLYATSPVFRNALDECAVIGKEYFLKPLIDIIYENLEDINQTAVTQPLLFCIEYALAKLWLSWGIEPDFVMGHSVGEYSAACIAGVLTLKEGLQLISARGRLMQVLPQNGTMVAVLAEEGIVLEAIGDYKNLVSIAAVNGSTNNVISGDKDAIAAICARLQQQKIRTTELKVSHAFHSPLMEPMMDEFAKIARKIHFKKPLIPLISNVTGKEIGEEIASAQYWVDHIRATVRFADAMTTLETQKCTDFIEIGPSPVLIGMGRRCLKNPSLDWHTSLNSQSNNWQTLLESLAKLYSKGYHIDWDSFSAPYNCCRQTIPTYPFQRKSFWLSIGEKSFVTPIKSNANIPKREITAAATTTTTTTYNAKLNDHIYLPYWQETAIPQQENTSFTYILAGQIENGLALFLQQKQQSFAQITEQDELGLQYFGDKQERHSFAKTTQGYHKLSELITSEPIHLVYFWGCDANNVEDGLHSTHTLFQLLHAFAKLDVTTAIKITIVTQLTQKVKETDTVNPFGSMLWGMVRAIAIEHPDWCGGVVDIDANPNIENLHQLLGAAPKNIRVALRDATYYVQKLKRSSFSEKKAFSWHKNKTYVITGGLGSIGFYLAEQLKLRGVENLVVMDYKEPSVAQQKQIQQWNAQYVQCDLTNKQQVEDALTQLNKMPEVAVVLHAAGIPGNNVLIKDMLWDDFYKIACAKIKSTHNLCASLDANTTCVHFSSILTLFGIWGQGAYSVGNSFLDSFGQTRPNDIVINWGAWASGGMAATSGHDKLLQNLGMNSLPFAAGFSILENILAHNVKQSMVADVVWEKFMLQFKEGNEPDFFADIIHKTRSAMQQKQVQKYQVTTTSSNRTQNILNKLKEMASDLFGIDANEIEENASFMDMGGDSFVLIQVAQLISEEFAVTISFQELMDDVANLQDLAQHINNKLPQESQVMLEHFDSDIQNVSGTDMERVLANQVQLMAQHLQVLREKGVAPVLSLQNQQLTMQPGTKPSTTHTKATDVTTTAQTKKTTQGSALAEPELTEQQRKYLDDFIIRYCKKTSKSKERFHNYRRFLADRRSYILFSLTTKELVYPISGLKAQGSHIWDVNENEYVDVSMGFGVLLFGHTPPFIRESIEKQLTEAIGVGPQAYLAGEVAQGISQLTGNDRVCFCNSGTEAVMYALRIARTVTSRRKVVMFSGSYHGAHEFTLGYKTASGKTYPNPLASGIPVGTVEDMIILDYGDPESLVFVKEHAQELAAVLVEPIQSRNPSLQPKKFLQELRQITQESGVALIFDEILIGFRIALGGAQQWYGVKADIVTYGKIIGGGMPIGVISGKEHFMDAFDGGYWQYGDLSLPEKIPTFFGGTFNKNPMTMATSKAVVDYLSKEGQPLYDALNQRTANLVATLNDFLVQERVPIKVVSCGSLFRFTSMIPTTGYRLPIDVELFFYHMIYHGIYIWEGRVCFMSTVHSDEDCKKIFEAMKSSVADLRSAGFLQPLEEVATHKVSRLTHYKPIEKPQLRLICFPYAGGGASLFRDYHKKLPQGVEICPIQYPGRENLRKEKLANNTEELVADILPDIESLLDIPCIFFGYSLGALVAFETARELRRRNKPLPQQLIIAAHRSPHLPDSTVQIRHLADNEMLESLKQTFTEIPPEIWQHPEMLKAFTPMIRADITISETYQYKEEEPFTFPIVACGGTLDNHVSEEEILAWQKQTTGNFRSLMIPGNHFFLHDQEDMLISILSGELNAKKK